MTEDSDEDEFCYLVVKSVEQSWIAVALIVIALLITIYGVASFIKIKKYNQSKFVNRIYMLIISWGVCT